MRKIGIPNGKSQKVRIGVIAASSFVAQQAVIPAIEESSKAELVALASRSKASQLAGKYKIEVSDDYLSLIRSDAVDAIYIPLPNAMHAEAIRLAIANNKHVLCEKPLAMSEEEAAELALSADKSSLILMEAYMTHYHPRSQELLNIVSARNSISLKHIHASFSGTLTKPDDYRWKPELGGGSLRDVGIYLIAPILGATQQLPLSVVGQASWTSAGVDDSFAGLLRFKDGITASIFSSFKAGEGQSLEFILEKGRIIIDRAFTPSLEDNSFQVTDKDGKMKKFKFRPANCYLEMIDHFCDLVHEHASPLRPISESILVQKVIDHLLISARHGRIEYLEPQ